jgi:hypothetical protein
MIVRKLSLVNFRGFKQTQIEFQPGVNVIAGVNGAGKSSVLDALRTLAGVALFEVGFSRTRYARLAPTDVRLGAAAADLQGVFALGDSEVNCYVHHKSEPKYATVDKIKRKTRHSGGSSRTETTDIPNRYEARPIDPLVIVGDRTPFALYFSPHRALHTQGASSTRAQSGPEAVHTDALANREFNIGTVASWWRGQVTLANEGDDSSLPRSVEALALAVHAFIPEFENVSPELKTVGYTKPYGKSQQRIPIAVTTIMVRKGADADALDVEQLSDGERGMLSLVLDTARRLVLANPGLENPIRDGQAIVMIDEIELHLHPQWQREIIGKLTKTFPNCQFIVSTHSPLILGEVSANDVLLLDADGAVYRPNQSLGMDTNFILEFLMGTSQRDEATQTELTNIANLIEGEQYDEAEERINELRERVGTFPDLVRLETRIHRIRLLSE